MSYQKDLDEYTDDELNKELYRRSRLRKKGLCDYCEQIGEANSCKFPERHQIAVDYITVKNAPKYTGVIIRVNGLPCNVCGQAYSHAQNCATRSERYWR